MQDTPSGIAKRGAGVCGYLSQRVTDTVWLPRINQTVAVSKIKMHKKAQISVDFTITIFIAMILFLVILYSANAQQREMDYVIQSLDAKHISEKLAGEINDVYLTGNGAVKNVTLPETVHGGVGYTLRVYPRSVLVNYTQGGDRYYSHRTLTRNINGSGSYQELTPGIIQISNVNGTIYFT